MQQAAQLLGQPATVDLLIEAEYNLFNSKPGHQPLGLQAFVDAYRQHHQQQVRTGGEVASHPAVIASQQQAAQIMQAAGHTNPQAFLDSLNNRTGFAKLPVYKYWFEQIGLMPINIHTLVGDTPEEAQANAENRALGEALLRDVMEAGFDDTDAYLASIQDPQEEQLKRSIFNQSGLKTYIQSIMVSLTPAQREQLNAFGAGQKDQTVQQRLAQNAFKKLIARDIPADAAGAIAVEIISQNLTQNGARRYVESQWRAIRPNSGPLYAPFPIPAQPLQLPPPGWSDQANAGSGDIPGFTQIAGEGYIPINGGDEWGGVPDLPPGTQTEKKGGNTALLVGGIVTGLVILGGIIAAVMASKKRRR